MWFCSCAIQAAKDYDILSEFIVLQGETTMAVLFAGKAASKFGMTDPELVAFALPVAGNTQTTASWVTVSGAILTATGTGFTYDVNGVPLTGLVSSVNFDLLGDGEPNGLVTDPLLTLVTPVSLGLLAMPVGTPVLASADQFWAALLPGNDLITAPEAGNSQIFGDFLQVASSPFDGISRTGGNDTINAFVPQPHNAIIIGTARRIAGPLISGDTFSMFGGSIFDIALFADLVGGNDVITLRGLGSYAVTGDATDVGELATLFGGADVIVSHVGEGTLSGLTGFANPVAGDAFLVAFGTVHGGADRIIASNYAFLSELIVGDVRSEESGLVAGGNDRLIGQAGQEIMSGDVYFLSAGTLRGGADVMTGGQDSDILVGDFHTAVPDGLAPIGALVVATATGGNDVIHGDAGNDLIAGDGLNGDFGQGSVLTGGNDFLMGGEGEDIIFGDFGNVTLTGLFPVGGGLTGGRDIVDGGDGNDRMDGQRGVDTLSFASIGAGVVADLLTGVATGQGTDSFSRFENITGSALSDVLKGDGGANQLDGGEGNDTLGGRAGDDRLLGRGGNDRFAGSIGADVMIGGTGADTFIFLNESVGPVTTDKITDFQNGQDKLDLHAFAFANFAAVQALAVNTATGLKIDLPGQEIVIVTGLTLASFDVGDVVL